MELPLQPSEQLLVKLSRLPYSQNQVYNLTDKQADLYPLIDIRYLTNSSSNRFDLFKQLVGSIDEFNNRLTDWHSGKLQMASIRTEYNIYSNLKTRLQTIALIPGEELVLKNLSQCLDWFQQVSTKKFKTNVNNFFETIRSTTRQTKRPMTYDDQVYIMYKRFGRTQHSQLPPPHERLTNYKKRQSVFPLEDLAFTKQSFYSQRKINSMGMTNGKETIQSTARDLNTIDGDQQEDRLPIQNEDQLQEISEANQNRSIVEYKNTKKAYAQYLKDPEVAIKFRKANLGVRSNSLKHQSKILQCKKQQKEIVQQMVKWAKTKSRHETQLNKALQSRIRESTNGTLDAYPTQELKKRAVSLNTLRSVQLVPSVSSAKPQSKISLDLTKVVSSQKPGSHIDKLCQMNTDIKNQKIRQAIKQNFKNIEHCRYNDKRQTESDGRYTSQSTTRPPIHVPTSTLTSFMKRRSSSLANIIQKNSLQEKGVKNMQMVQRVRESLIRKGAYMSSKTIQNSLNVFNFKKQQNGELYKCGSGLLSNPWFPKGKGKKSKKKKM